MNYFDSYLEEHQYLTAELHINRMQHSCDSEIAEPLHQNSMSLAPQYTMSKEIDYKDSHVIQPLNFSFDNDTKSSMSTPQNEERRISKGKVVVENEHKDESVPQTNLDIDCFFSDLLEFREQDNKLDQAEPV